MKTIIILGDNNFWYSYASIANDEQIKNEIEVVKHGINNNEYDTGQPSKLFVYEVTEIKSVTL